MGERDSDRFERELERWREHYLAKPERDADFETLSGEPLQALYTPEDVREQDYARDLGFPGRAGCPWPSTCPR